MKPCRRLHVRLRLRRCPANGTRRVVSVSTSSNNKKTAAATPSFQSIATVAVDGSKTETPSAVGGGVSAPVGAARPVPIRMDSLSGGRDPKDKEYENVGEQEIDVAMAAIKEPEPQRAVAAGPLATPQPLTPFAPPPLFGLGVSGETVHALAALRFHNLNPTSGALRSVTIAPTAPINSARSSEIGCISQVPGSKRALDFDFPSALA